MLRRETRWDHLVRSPLNLVCDSHLSPRRWPRVPLRRRIAWTTRYRAAAAGLKLSINERRLEAFADLHRGDRCFILGNGPSLNQCDLRPLESEFTFGVNSIFLNRGTMGFDPTYYVVEDPLVAEDRAGEINAYQGPAAKFFGNYLRRFIEPTNDIIWTNVRLRYDEYANFPHFSSNALRQLWAGGTVSYLCLQLAYYMGFRTVHLVGFDHSYTVPAAAKIEGNRIESTSDDPNHFHPDYFGKGYRWHSPRTDRMEIAYRRAKDVFNAEGRTIHNATVGGRLEVFPRVQYASLFRGRSRAAA